MRVVVFGATGNLGTSLLDRLARDDRVDSVVGVSRRAPDLPHMRVTWAEADIGVDPLEPLVDGADAVVHLAWGIQPSRDEAGLHRTNVTGSRRIVDACLATGCPALLYASSVGTYAPGPKDRPQDEAWPHTGVPTSLYSRHKAEVERMLDAVEAAGADLRIVRMRPGLVLKAGAASEIARLFLGPLVPLRLLGRRHLPAVPSNPRLVVQVVHSHDVATAFVAALHSRQRGPFNLAADPVVDSVLLARAFQARAVPVPGPVLRALTAASWRAHLQPTDPGWVDLALGVPVMDTSRARRHLGWEPTLTSDETLADLLTGFARGEGQPTPPLQPARSEP